MELPVHPELVGLVLRDEAQDDLLDLTETEKRIVRSLLRVPLIADHFGEIQIQPRCHDALDQDSFQC